MGLPSPVYWARKRKAESPGEPEFYCAKVPRSSVITAGTEAAGEGFFRDTGQCHGGECFETDWINLFQASPGPEGLHPFSFPFFLKEDYTAFLCITNTTVRRGLENAFSFTVGIPSASAHVTAIGNRDSYGNKNLDLTFWVSEHRCSCTCTIWKISFCKTAACTLRQGARLLGRNWESGCPAGIRTLRGPTMVVSK